MCSNQATRSAKHGYQLTAFQTSAIHVQAIKMHWSTQDAIAMEFTQQKTLNISEYDALLRGKTMWWILFGKRDQMTYRYQNVIKTVLIDSCA